MNTPRSTDWPDELLPDSDRRQCEMTLLYDSGVTARESMIRNQVMWAPRRANCGLDAGIVANAPRAAPGGCWPEDMSRSTSSPLQSSGFYVAVCAPSNVNEVRRDRPLDPSSIGAVCSRSHQTFMNTTRKCTGTQRPNARGSCRRAGGQIPSK